ncbi:MAG: transposase [Candidatus Cloacimonadales bacterium]
MIKKKETQQPELEFVILDDLVHSDHLLRYIDGTINFNFIYDKVEHLYSTTTGRPAIDPVVIFKMFLIQYMYGIKSECQLMKEIQVNVAYRWFLGFKLTDKIPHSSVFSQNRRRRFTDSSVFQEIFEDIVEQAFKL